MNLEKRAVTKLPSKEIIKISAYESICLTIPYSTLDIIREHVFI
jgi:hypothetical protein